MTFLAFFSKFYRLNNQICLTHFLAFLFDIGLVKLYFIKVLFKKTFPMPVKGQSEHSGLPWLSAVWFILRLVFQLSILLTLLKKWQGSFCLICEQNSRSKTTLYVYCQPNLRKIVSIFPVFFRFFLDNLNRRDWKCKISKLFLILIWYLDFREKKIEI